MLQFLALLGVILVIKKYRDDNQKKKGRFYRNNYSSKNDKPYVKNDYNSIEKWDSFFTDESEDHKYYVKKDYYMTEAENNFFKVLTQAVQDKYYIVPQVPIKNLVYVNKYEPQKQKFYQKIQNMSVDFVLFSKEKYSPEIIIELDDTSHLLPDREKRDYFVNQLFERMGIKIVHIKTAYNYDLKEIEEKISRLC